MSLGICVMLFTAVVTAGADVFNMCDARMDGFGDDALGDGQPTPTSVDFSLQTPGFPANYSRDSCACMLTSRDAQERFTLNMTFTSYRLNTQGCPSLLHLDFPSSTDYSFCTSAYHVSGRVTHVHLRAGDVITFVVANPLGHDVKASVQVQGIIGESVSLVCEPARSSNLDAARDSCSCDNPPPEFFISRPPESATARVVVAVVLTIVFLAIAGAALLAYFCIRRRKQRADKLKAASKLKPKPVSNFNPTYDSPFQRASGLLADPGTPKNGHYAEIDFGAHPLSFTPDPELRLGLRQSVDSGMYSEPGDPKQQAGLASRDSQPVSQSSPKETPGRANDHVVGDHVTTGHVTGHVGEVDDPLDQLYARPSKRGNTKSNKGAPVGDNKETVSVGDNKGSSLQRYESEDSMVYQHPPLPTRSWNAPPSLHLQPSYLPDPTNPVSAVAGYTNPLMAQGSRSGSRTGSLTGHGLNDLHRSLGSSTNEMYATDSQSTLHKAVSSAMETDI